MTKKIVLTVSAVLVAIFSLALSVGTRGHTTTYAANKPTPTPTPTSTGGNSQPIYGLFFYQTMDDVHIVYYNHQYTDGTDEYFGTSYNSAAVAGCASYVQSPYLVRYRLDPVGTYTALCYSDPNNYVSVPGTQFGMDTINAAVARARQIVYPSPTPTPTP